jgi:Alternative complex III, ActD subunit
MATATGTGGAAVERKVEGFLVEFDTPGGILAAAQKVRDAGFRRWDAHTPFPVHGLDRAMGLRASLLPWIVMVCGVTGCLTGLGLQWWTNAHNYQFLISGKPFWSIPANIPVTFELTILFSAFGAFLGMLGLNGFPRWNHPVFSSERFRRATQDRFFLSVEAGDPLFDEATTGEFLKGLGGIHVEKLEV